MNLTEWKLHDSTDLRRALRKTTVKEQCQLEGYQDALKKHYKQITYDYIQDHLEDFEVTMFPKINEYYKNKYIPYRKNSKQRWKYAMITINPRTDTTYETLIKCYNKAMKKKYISQSVSCIEWTTDEKWDQLNLIHNGNMHIHISIQINNKDPYRIKSEFYNSFKNITSPQCVTIRYSNNPEAFIKYINGLKENKPKVCMSYTNKYRILYNVPLTF